MRNPRMRPGGKYYPECVAAIIVATALPMVAGWVPPNPYYGFRIPRTLASTAEWYCANSLMGWHMIASQAMAVMSMDALCRAMEGGFGKDRVTWGVLWSCATALVGIGTGLLHYALRV